MNPVQALTERDVSIWLDTLSRELVEDGGLGTLMSDLAVGGVTSNPTIFATAIDGSDRYDHQLRDELRAGVHDPHELWQRLDARNAMIKVPATEPGVEAIEELTALGVSVNVTLLFAVERYEQVIEAYLRGLERRVRRGEPLHGIASVASFFVSRVDAKADARLAPGSPLRGRIAIANARIAYARWWERFAGPRWDRLAAHGAAVQRPLWASTATKDPSYRDVTYLEQLALPGSILTVPERTLRAFADHGDPARTEPLDPQASEHVLAATDLAAIAAELEHEGVEAFCDSYGRLLAAIAARAAVIEAATTRPPPGRRSTGSSRPGRSPAGSRGRPRGSAASARGRARR